MTLQELLIGKGIDLKRTKLLRHNLTNEAVASNYKNGLLELYQSIQSPTLFQSGDIVINFLGTEGTNGVFQDCYRVGSSVPYYLANMPEKFMPDKGMKDGQTVIYAMTKLDLFSDLKDRLVIDWGKGTINFCHNGTTVKEILTIRPSAPEVEFKNYDNVILSFDDLCKIVFNKEANKIWEYKLSAVAGVYLIADKKTGKHYVGSASGENGIWGRWSEYAQTKHGGNTLLKKLIADDPDYCQNFQYSILEVFPIKKAKDEVLEYEKLYKKKLLSFEFGLNDNI